MLIEAGQNDHVIAQLEVRCGFISTEADQERKMEKVELTTKIVIHIYSLPLLARSSTHWRLGASKSVSVCN